MARKVRLCLAAVGLTGLLAVALGAVALTGASSYTSNGDLIAGWHWLRSPGHSATYTFDVRAVSSAKSAYLNASFLVTNGVNGGCGYGGNVKLEISNNLGKRTSTTLTLNNPFRPQDPENSHGVGYEAYGACSIPTSVWSGASTIKVQVTNPSPSTRHVAVKREGLVLATR